MNCTAVRGGAPRVMLSTYSGYGVICELMVFEAGDNIISCCFCNRLGFVYFVLKTEIELTMKSSNADCESNT